MHSYRRKITHRTSCVTKDQSPTGFPFLTNFILPNMNTAICQISKKRFPLNELYKGEFLKKEIFDLVKRDFPDFNGDSYISIESLNEYRKKYMASLLKQENAELNEMESQVINSITKNELLSKDLEEEMNKDLTPAQRIADKIATFGGSWTFIGFFFFFILLWMSVIGRSLIPTRLSY